MADCSVPRPELRRRSLGPIRWLETMRRALGDLGQRDFDGAIELWIRAARIVLRRVVDFDVRVGAIVLDSPPDVVEEERELGLGGYRTVDQAVPRPDADDATPGAFAHQRPQLHHFEGVREDVA